MQQRIIQLNAELHAQQGVQHGARGTNACPVNILLILSLKRDSYICELYSFAYSEKSELINDYEQGVRRVCYLKSNGRV